jgi:peptide-methionine (S)-S-oxide reductase
MKKIGIVVSLFVLVSGLMACQNQKENKNIEFIDYSEQDLKDKNLKTAYFASGCFWCVEAVFQSVKGVKDAVSGYSGGEKENPTYEQIGTGTLKHAEAVKVIYDPTQIDFKTLVIVFFGSQDPTTLNRQGPDRGSQYRSIAFYENENEKKVILDYINQLNEDKVYSAPIVTEVKEFTTFWKAEEYHQEYERLHPENPYVRGVSIPRLKKFQVKFPELLKGNH